MRTEVYVVLFRQHSDLQVADVRQHFCRVVHVRHHKPGRRNEYAACLECVRRRRSVAWFTELRLSSVMITNVSALIRCGARR